MKPVRFIAVFFALTLLSFIPQGWLKSPVSIQLIPQANAIEGDLKISGTVATASGNIYAPALYDVANPAYFLDPNASGQSMHTAGSISIGTTTNTELVNIAGGIGFANGPQIVDFNGNLQLRAGGSTEGSGGNSSIYFTDTGGNVTGRFDTAHTPSGASAAGTGDDGALVVDNGTKRCDTDIITGARTQPDCFTTNLTAAASNVTTITVASTAGFAADDEVLMIQMTGASTGNYETKRISSVPSGTSVILQDPVVNSYSATGAQMIRVPNYTDVTVCGGATGGGCTVAATLTNSAWNGTTGGILFLRANGTFAIQIGGVIDASGIGFRGGAGGGGGSGGGGGAACSNDNKAHSGGGGGAGGNGTIGEGITGAGSGKASASSNDEGGGGGGGAYLTSTDGIAGAGVDGGVAGSGGNAIGTINFNGQLFPGGGGAGGAGGHGGAGGKTSPVCSGTGGGDGGDGGAGGAGGAGGGIVAIFAGTLTNSGIVRSNGVVGSIGSNGLNGQSKNCIGCYGGSGGGSGGGGGGGAGGSVWLASDNLTAGTVTVTGGAAPTNTSLGGNGGSAGPNVDGGNGGGRGGLGGAKGSGGSNGSPGPTSPDATGGSGSNGQITTGALPTGGYGSMYLGRTETSASDIAEQYPSHDTLSPGDVVAFDPAQPGFVRRTGRAYDTLALGIVSTDPGVVLGNPDKHSDTPQFPIALAGRVPVKIDPSSEPIHIGDFLTSSSMPGLATRAMHAGPVVARAMDNWTPADGATSIMTFIHIQNYAGNITADGTFVAQTVQNLTVTGTIAGSQRIRDSAAVPAHVTGIQVLSGWKRAPTTITVSPSWDTTTYITNLTNKGFTINFGTPPDGDESVGWQAIW